MDTADRKGPSLAELPRIELVSLYMNRYERLAAEERRAFEAEFARRGLPAPRMDAPAAAAAPARPAGGKGGLDQKTFLSYALLIYTVTGVFYSWVYLSSRLLGRQAHADPRHRLILTVVSLAYVALEAAAAILLGLE